MNKSFLKMTICVSVALSLGSCRETNMVAPDESNVSMTQTVKDDISPGIPKNYRLIQFGEANLTYYDNGQLKRVMHGADTPGNTNYYREYTYIGSNTIKATSYIGGKIALEDTYLIDPVTKRCYESKQVDYFLSGISSYPTNASDISHTFSWLYEYNAQGQLKTCTKKGSPGTRTEFTYNANGDLTKAVTFISYLKNGVEVQTGERYSATFTYNVPPSQRSNSPLTLAQYLDDANSLNSPWIHLPNSYGLDCWGQPIPERYLRIFGKTSKHLLMSFTRHDPNDPSYKSGSYFSYILNGDGYVTSRKEYNSYNSTLLETKVYNYLVTTLGVQY